MLVNDWEGHGWEAGMVDSSAGSFSENASEHRFFCVSIRPRQGGSPTPRMGSVQYPQVLVYEQDGTLAHLLRRGSSPAGEERDWVLREPRRPESCLRLLRRGQPSVFVLKVGHDLERELSLLERVGWELPDTSAVVVGENENPVLARLCWDLGAAYVLFPPESREMLPEIVASLLQTKGTCRA